MAFIWNDERAKFVNLTENWDKNGYVIARTLFVESNKKKRAVNKVAKKITRKITEEALHEAFNKYGPIESIQILNHRIDSKADEKYAYIQYFDSKDAYLAYLDMQKSRKSQYSVMPADTWHQPKSSQVSEDMEVSIDDDTMTFDGLIDYCLIQIFENCDEETLVNLSEVNQRFYRILSEYIFPKQKMFRFYIGTYMNLNKMRRYLQCYGPHLTEAEIEFSYKTQKNLRRILKKFTQCVGPKLRKLCIRGMDLKEDDFNELESALKDLEVLKIIPSDEDHDCEMDFKSLCPNLRKLKYCAGRFMNHFETWPTLENLWIQNDEDRFDDSKFLSRLMSNNPQLKRLTILARDCVYPAIKCVGKYLNYLEKLTIIHHSSGMLVISAISASKLLNLEHLNTLKLMQLVSKHQALEALRFLVKLTGLRKIKLHFLDPVAMPDPRLFVALAQKLLDLKIFHIASLALEKSAILDFIRQAEKLEEFCIHFWHVELDDDEFFRSIVNIRKNLRATQPLKLILDPFENTNTKELLKQKEIKKYLQVETCGWCTMHEHTRRYCNN